jgi:Ca2+-binding RTX toxin-like protein
MAALATTAATALCVLPASPASAAGNIVSISDGVLRYSTLPFYASNVVIRFSGGLYTVDDLFPMQAVSGCSHPDADTTFSVCTATGVTSAYVSVGDMDDTVDYWAPVPVRVLGGAGNDYIITGDNEDTLEGGPGNDVLNGWDGLDWLFGGPGPDDMYGGADYDIVSYLDHATPVTATLDGVVGNDGSAGEGDTIRADIESIEGGTADDTLKGNGESNLLRGAGGSDLLYGLGGDDELQGDGRLGSGYYPDFMYGGPGNDSADYFDHTAGVVVDLDGAIADDGAPGEGDTIGSDVESVRGGFGPDTLTGNAGPNVLDGRWGNDTLIGLAGNDTLEGRTEADTFDGGLNTDTCDYVAGVDVSQVGCE